jgi:hypothetical protein
VSDSSDSGIFVIESPAGDEPVPLQRETVAAFVGPASRGPANVAIKVTGVEDFRARFGSPAERSRMEWIVGQFFENGGRDAVVVRVPRAGSPARLSLPGHGGPLQLVAVNPGPLEFLRAAIDFDGLPAGDRDRFNLTVQRIREPANPLVEEQEIYRSVSVSPGDERYVGDALAGSLLVRLAGEPPAVSPEATAAADRYVSAENDWRGSAPPGDYELVGSGREGTGLNALDQVACVDLVCVVSGSPDADVGPVALFAAERYCRRRNALLLLDPPTHWRTPADVVRSQRERGLASPNVLTYFPRLTETTAAGEPTQPLSALGAICGLLAQRDREILAGGLRSPARPPPALLRSRLRPVRTVTGEEAQALQRSGCNVLRPAGRGLVELCGEVTLARHGGSRREWRSLNYRRRALFAIDAIARGTRWAAIRSNDSGTWTVLREQVSRYLDQLRAVGILAGASSREAYYVKCDEDTNNASGPVSMVVGLALANPREFVAFRFEHEIDSCRIAEIAWQPGLALAV